MTGDMIKSKNTDFYKMSIYICYENASKWCKKEIPHDALMKMYENIDTDNGTIRIDFPYIRDKLQCKIFNSDRECIDIDSLKIGNNIILLLFFKGLKIYSSNFHLDFHINQIKLIENDFKILKEYSIIDDDEDNTETIDEFIFNYSTN